MTINNLNNDISLVTKKAGQDCIVLGRQTYRTLKKAVTMTEINWQPVSFLPQIRDMINGMLDAAKETYEPLRQIKVHDDYTIERIFEVTGKQVEDEWLYDEQLSRWMKDKNLKPAQRIEIQTLQERMEKLKQVNRKILAIAEVHKNKTIEKIMSKSDAELGLAFLLGRPK